MPLVTDIFSVRKLVCHAPGSCGVQFVTILAVNCQEVIDQSWNSEIPLVFAHTFLINMLVIRWARDIWARLTHMMEFWDKVLHTGLVGDAEAEGETR